MDVESALTTAAVDARDTGFIGRRIARARAAAQRAFDHGAAKRELGHGAPALHRHATATASRHYRVVLPVEPPP
jgi:hypothetical protein